MYSTFTKDAVATTLTLDSMKEAFKALEESSKKPFCTAIKSRKKGIELLRKSFAARDFSFHLGIPVIQDKSIPKDMFRVEMSDGTYEDLPMKNPSLYSKRG